MRGELWYQGLMVASVEDSGYTSIDDVVESIEIPGEIPSNASLLYKVINKDKGQEVVKYRNNR
jgi:hypothetical protein